MAAFPDLHRASVIGNNALAVNKFNLFPRPYCTVENINVIVYLLIGAFETVFNVHLLCQLLCRSLAAKGGYLFDKLLCFLFRDKACGLNGVNKQTKLRLFKFPRDKVITVFRRSYAENFHSVVSERLNITVYRLSLALNTFIFEHCLQSFGAHRVAFIAVFFKIILNKQKL